MDVHLYDFMEMSVDELTGYLGIGLADTRKPVIVGEYGATAPTTPFAEAPSYLKGLLQDACNAGYKGYFLFTWDSDTTITGLIYWSALSGSGEINSAVAPVRLPDACAPAGRAAHPEAAGRPAR